MQSDFNFLDDLIPKDSPSEDRPTLSDEEIQRLREEEVLENTEGYNEAKKSFSKMDMSSLKFTELTEQRKNKHYNCIVVGGQLMGQNGMPFAFHKDLHTETVEIAAEQNGRVQRLDKVFPDFLKVNQLDDCAVVLIHRKKSTDQIIRQQRIDRMRHAEANKQIIFASLQYDNRTYKHFKIPAEKEALKVELGLIDTEKNPITPYEENRFIVFKTEYVYKFGTPKVLEALMVIENHINSLRLGQGKNPIAANKYYVCNQDEPYAEEVKRIILIGEDNKLHTNKQKE